MRKLTKILIMTFLLVIALSSVSSLTSQAASKGKYFLSGELYYHTISKNKVEVCGTTRNEGTLTIPSSVYYKGKKYTVTQIADHEIYYQDKPVTQETTNGYDVDINMPGWRYYCYNRIDGKEMPMDVNWISGSRIKKVILPSTLTYIGEGAFCGCEKLKSVVFANSYKKLIVGKNVFGGTALESLRFPNGTYELKDCAAGTVAEIYIPASVKKIGAGVVNHKTKKVTIDKKNKKFKMKNGILYSYNEKILIGASSEVPKRVKISEKTTKIIKQAFAGTKVTNVTLNNKIKTIPAGLFYDCKKLTRVNNTNGVTKIGYGAFAFCKNLKSIGRLPKVKRIGRAAFWDDIRLNIHISATVTDIDEYAFVGSVGSAPMTVTVDENNTIYSIEEGFLIKATETEKIVIMQLSIEEKKLIIPEGITSVPVKVGGYHCKEIVFPATLKKQNGVACVNNGKIIYNASTVPEFGKDFGLINFGKDVLTVVVPKGTLKAYKKAINSVAQDEDGVDFFIDGFNEIKEQE